MEYIKEYIECDCHSELLQLSFEADYSSYECINEDNCPVDLRFLYISYYSLGHNIKHSWKARLLHIWHILKNGHPWEDTIILRKPERLKLTQYLNSLEQDVSIDKDESINKEVSSIFHKLWTLSVGTDNYDKKDWQFLAKVLSDSGYKV